MRELDDAEHGLLVEVGLGEDELVGAFGLEQRGEPLERLRPAHVGDRLDDLDLDPPACGAELALEVAERLALADEDEPATHAERPGGARARSTRRRARSAPIASALVTTAVGISPVVEKS